MATKKKATSKLTMSAKSVEKTVEKLKDLELENRELRAKLEETEAQLRWHKERMSKKL